VHSCIPGASSDLLTCGEAQERRRVGSEALGDSVEAGCGDGWGQLTFRA